MARPPKYTTEDAKPVGISLRLPRELYDQARRHAARRGTTLTELVVEGLQMRLETPTDPRDILVIRDDTVMQELKQMITAEVQAVLAAQAIEAPKPARPRKTARKRRTQHYSHTTSEHTYAPEPGQSLVTEKRPRGLYRIRAGRKKSGLVPPPHNAFVFPVTKACLLPLLSCKVCPSCKVTNTTPETHEALALPRRGGCCKLVGRLWDSKQARALQRGESGSTQGW